MRKHSPWYTDISKQAAVLNRIANRNYGKTGASQILRDTQNKLWNKFDAYFA